MVDLTGTIYDAQQRQFRQREKPQACLHYCGAEGEAMLISVPGVAHSGREWKRETGVINGQKSARHLGTLQGAIYYIAGSSPMVAAVREMLVGAGVDEDDVRTEEFGGY